MMSTVKGRVMATPKRITTPIGIQRASALIIIGSTPRPVVQEVRKMGRIRREPASIAASL